MVAYNFKSCFADDVENGKKRQTVRANGKRSHAKPGQSLQLYTGMRTKGCRKLLDTECKKSIPVRIEDSAFKGQAHVVLNGVSVNAFRFAEADGFKSVESMLDFFRDTHGLPFEGTLISW